MLKTIIGLSCLLLSASLSRAEVRAIAHYDLQGLGGVRDTPGPARWKSSAKGADDLIRHGNVKVMSDAPESRRTVYDSSLNFEGTDECYQGPRALASGEHWVLEAWAYARRADDPGLHAVVANGDGGVGFLLCQDGRDWEVYVGGSGGVPLARVKPDAWVHLALVRDGGQTVGYVDGQKVAVLPALSGGSANFGVGATAPGRESFHGRIAEVRVSDYSLGKFDPSTDFLIDADKMRAIGAKARAERTALVQRVLRTPGVQAVSTLDERPADADWLIAPPSTHAAVQVVAGKDNQTARIMLCNGLVSRTFFLGDNLACVSLRRSDKKREFIRAVKPEARFRVNGSDWVEVGGLTGAPEKAYLSDAWLSQMQSKPRAFRFIGLSVGPCVKPYDWRPKCNAVATPWPAAGKRVDFHFIAPADAEAAVKDLTVDVSYEIYDGLPVIMKTFSIANGSGTPAVVNEINGECLAVLQDGVPLMHVESDYSFALANVTNHASALGLEAPPNRYAAYFAGGGTTRWESDPEYGSAATLNPAEDLFLNNPERCLLISRPPTGPGYEMSPGGEFQAMRTFEILNDSTDKERVFLAQRRFYNKLAPQTTEYQIELHDGTHDVPRLKKAIDQMADCGLDRLQIEYPDGIAYEDLSEANVNWLREVCAYAGSKGIRVGAYQLMVASVGRGAADDCIDPVTGKPGSAFGQSTCLCSRWGQTYRVNMFKLIDATGLGSFDPDGPYHGDPCASTTHPGHRGLEDSQWMQWRAMDDILHECQAKGLYVTAPDWYFLNGQVCIGMGYREASDSLPIVLQTMVHRQYMFDATYQKTAGMGWMNFNLGTLRGGMERDLPAYEVKLFQMLSYGAQTWIAGSKLYDGPESRAMVKRLVAWSKEHRDVIRGDLIHLRRPDGRSLDYVMHVRPGGREKGMLLVFNPTAGAISETIDLPLYYTGIADAASIRERDGKPVSYKLDRRFNVGLPVDVPAGGYTWFVIE